MKFDQVPAARDRGRRCARMRSRSATFISLQRSGFVLLMFCAAGTWMGMSVVWKVEIWYWSGFLGSVSCVEPSVRCRSSVSGTLADEQAFARQLTRGAAGSVKIGEEHAFPERAARHRLDVLHVEDDLGEAFVKHARLDFERSLRRLAAGPAAVPERPASAARVDAVGQSEQPCAPRQKLRSRAERSRRRGRWRAWR